jgi:2-polyprenyl-3-methyl-5-hydroxy-6-metoxy-1,4-benzoquinol methylase
VSEVATLYEQFSNSRLAQAEPEFFKIWVSHVTPDDPQLARWVEYEGGQIDTGRTVVRQMEGYLPLAGRRVLDVGCQWGAATIALAQAGADVTGVDVFPPFIEGAQVRAREHGAKAEFLVAPAEKLPFADASFDSVLCQNVIEHVASHRRAVEEIARALKPGGRVYLDGPNRLSPSLFWKDPHYEMLGISVLPFWLGDFYVRKVRRYPAYHVGVFPLASSILRLFVRNGLSIVASSYPGGSGAGRGLGKLVETLRRSAGFNFAPKFFLVGEKRPA